MDFKARPIKKCRGVSTSIPSSGEESSGVRGLLLRAASISTVREYNSSMNRLCGLTTLVKSCFMDFTAASHKPPKCGERAGV